MAELFRHRAVIGGFAGVCACLAAVSLPGVASAQSAARVRLQAPSRVAADGLAVFRGRVTGGASGRVVLEESARSSWVRLVAGREGRHGRFALTWIVRSRPGHARVRVLVYRSGRLAAVSRSRRLLVLARRGPKVVVSPKTAVLAASTVAKAPKPGSAGTLQYSGGNTVGVGQVIAVGVGPATPDGFLGRVTGVRTVGTQTLLSTKPATLMQAVRTGSFDVSSRHQSAPLNRAAGTAIRRETKSAFNCTGSTSASVDPSLNLSVWLDAKADWSFNPFHFGLQSASLTAHGQADGNLTVAVTGKGSCTLSQINVWKSNGPTVTFSVGPVPVVITSKVYLDVKANATAQAALSAGIGASFDAEAGVGWTKSGFYGIHDYAQNFTHSGPTLTASASAEADLVPKVQILLYGVAGSEVDLRAGLRVNADITKNPWWTVGVPVDLSASLKAPPLGLSSQSLDVYNHTFPLANAGGPFGGDKVTVTSPGDQTSTEGNPVDLQIQATDNAGKALTYKASGLPAGLAIDSSSGLITGTPTSVGVSSVTVTATDTGGVSGKASFTWTVDVSSATVTVDNPGDQTGTVGTPADLQIDASDTDGGALTYSATGLPTGLTIDPDTGEISGTPTTVEASTVEVTATDETGPTGSTSFAWAITSALTTFYSTNVNGGYVAAGVGMRNLGYGHISITGIPSGSTIQAAFLLWDVLDDSQQDADAQGVLDGSPITGTLLGVGDQPCWLASNNYAYEADVTSLVTGNGSYSLTGFSSGVTDGSDPWLVGSPVPELEGASLIVVYRNAASPLTHVDVAGGSTETLDSPIGATFGGFTASATPRVNTTFVVADGQDIEDGPATFDGADLDPGDFQGLDPMDVPPYSEGNLWDTSSYDVSADVAAGDTSATASITGASSDCLVWVGQALSVH